MTAIQLLSAPGVIRIAVINAQKLLDFAIWYPGHSDGFGDLYLGRVEHYTPALGGAFVALGKDFSGFLPNNATAKPLLGGDWITVRVTRSAQGGKGVRLDARNLDEYSLPQDKSFRRLQAGISPFEELAQRWSDADILIDEPALIQLIPTDYTSRVKISNAPLSSELLEQIDALETSEVQLPMGMRATITPTPALVAIDMDTAAQSNDRQHKLRAQFNANKESLPALLHHLRLRNLSGAIIVDMAGLPIKKRRLFQENFEQSLALDPLQPRFLGFTNLGLAEITRPRKRPPLHELLTSTHGQMTKILAQLEQEFKALSTHHHYHHLTLTLSLTIKQALQNDSWAINHFEKRCAVSLTIESNPSFTMQQWEYHYA
ncbi:ribonuclease E/G [Commensalibacter nepenthis]|uniref:Ribonuclease E/G n=1 Tax=Commensalibacter nepenthis TaxID=3043872 RepID=A0ABT6Q8G7_9PROT|nr:ribonuclease E/G [Commensalibacter sp. TBRC 10068]MDI2113200.1 ribonuclease E/G [Commensalibacter sp. TBRC 10068]